MASLTSPEQDFLIQNLLLTYLDPEVCSALFDGFTDTDYRRMLDNLIAKNLFILCVDEKADIYRYHNILDYLAQQFQCLPAEQRQTLQLKSAALFERRGDLEEALRVYTRHGFARTGPARGARYERANGGVELSGPDSPRTVDSGSGPGRAVFPLQYGQHQPAPLPPAFNAIKEAYDGTDNFGVIRYMEACSGPKTAW